MRIWECYSILYYATVQNMKWSTDGNGITKILSFLVCAVLD